MPSALAASKPAVPATTLYDPQAVPTGWGAVIIGREPEKYDMGAVRAHDQAGGITFVYIDPVYLEPFGSTATRLHRGSTVMPGTTSKTALIDDALIGRTRDEIHRIRERFANIERLAVFSDDTGPDNTTFYPTTAARDQAYPRVVALMQAEREVCDELGMRTQANAVWDGRFGHGYPLKGTHGCGLADFLMAERHGYAITRVGDFWEAYLRTGQTNLRDADGRGMHFAIVSTMAEGTDALRSPDIAFISVQPSGTYARAGAKVSAMRDLGIPFGAPEPPPPPPPPDTDPCASVRAERDAALVDRDGARAERDAATAARDRAVGEANALRSEVAAETLRHSSAVAAILNGSPVV